MAARCSLVRWYQSYLDACNARDWIEVAARTGELVVVNGMIRTRTEYIGDIKGTLESFPDYRWELQRAVVEGEWLAVRLHDRGTRSGPFRGAPGDKTVVETVEFNMYRVVDGVIVELEGSADNARLIR